MYQVTYNHPEICCEYIVSSRHRSYEAAVRAATRLRRAKRMHGSAAYLGGLTVRGPDGLQVWTDGDTV